jgi:hypothetical protein
MAGRQSSLHKEFEEITKSGSMAEIPELDIDSDIIDNSFIVLFGRRGSGKSFLGRRIIKRFSDIPKIKIVCPSEKLNKDYSKHVPGICIDDDYIPETLETIFLDQEEVIEKINQYNEIIEETPDRIEKYRDLISRRRVDPGLGNAKIAALERIYKKAITALSEMPDPRVLYVADDIMFKKTSPLKDEQFRKLVFNGRHSKITGLYMSQYPLGVPKDMRGCIDYVFILAEDSESSRNLLYENYGQGIFSNKYLFFSVMDACTTDRRALVLKLTKTSNDDQTKEIAKNDIDRMKGKVFWYRADSIGKFRWPNSILWELHNKYYDEHAQERKRQERRAEIETRGIIIPKKKQSGVAIKLSKQQPSFKPPQSSYKAPAKKVIDYNEVFPSHDDSPSDDEFAKYQIKMGALRAPIPPGGGPGRGGGSRW